jgi:stage V sporulation protein SpoVS
MSIIINAEDRMPNPAWVNQQLDAMAAGINAGATRKRKVASVTAVGSNEAELQAAVAARGWRLAQVGNDYVVAPAGYVIRPIV